MYSDKVNLSILTSLLSEHDVRQVVVCPGSRNAAIVHNLTACPEITCHRATDERSGAFEAMGIALATGKPAAICVTSGSALLNCAPAVAEAWYQHVPLIVISADRPSAWIEQLDGQTIDQPGALSRWCCTSVNLPQVKSVNDRWHCNWLVNKAMLTALRLSRPAHINVPLGEPLYEFSMKELSEERVVRMRSTEEMAKRFAECEKVMIVVGQRRDIPSLEKLSESAAVVAEPLAWCDVWSDGERDIERLDRPEMVIYLGGTIVSKKVKHHLRTHKHIEQWFVSTDGDMADTFMNLRNVVFDNIDNVVRMLEEVASYKSYASSWNCMRKDKNECSSTEEMMVEYLESYFAIKECNVCYANSMSVRYACRHVRHNIFCNRGVNGIEGTISTALGIARGSEKTCICVTGDLSFLYDSNALWRTDLPQNLRILVFNNGGGKIFERFKELEGDEARGAVTGEHNTSCGELCRMHGVDYRKIKSSEFNQVYEMAIEWLVIGDSIKVLEYENMEKN